MLPITSRPSRTVAVTLLEGAGLPTQDITDELLEHFFVAGDPSSPLGIVGLELSPPHSLLRSLAVVADARTRGIGSRLLEHAEEQARAHGVRSIYLLTTTAEPFFSARGYQRADRGSAPLSIRSSAEFASLCPASAAFMVKHI